MAISILTKYDEFKVVREVNTELGFMDWFFYNLIIPIKYCKIPYKNFGKALYFSRNCLFCLENWKLWRASTTIELKNIFYWNSAHVSYLPMPTKGTEWKVSKYRVLSGPYFPAFGLNTERYGEIRSNTERYGEMRRDTGKCRAEKTPYLDTFHAVRVFGIFLFGVDLELFAKIKKDLVSTHSGFYLTWFLRNNRKNFYTQILSKFRYQVLHYLIHVFELLKKWVRKSQFYINHASHLKTKIQKNAGSWKQTFDNEIELIIFYSEREWGDLSLVEGTPVLLKNLQYSIVFGVV